MPVALLALLIGVNAALAVGSIYRALRPDPSLPLARQYAGAVFGLLMALGVILLLVATARHS